MSRDRFAAFAATLLLAVPSLALAQQSATTRFGPVSIDRNVLLFQGKPVIPSVQGDMSLGLDQVLQVGSYDAIIVRNNLGGNGCPVMFYVVMVTGQNARASKAFGTCSEAAEVSKKGNGVSLAMPTVSTLAQQRAGKGDAGKVHVFDVVNGVVTDTVRR